CIPEFQSFGALDRVPELRERSQSPRLRDEHAKRPRGRKTTVADHIREILKLRPSHYLGDT
ncbi:hypothetical protein KI387_020957, partial [Taxus chinensis]